MPDIQGVIHANDYDELMPYQYGDYTLLCDVASWLLSAYTHGRMEWELGQQEMTVDGLSMAITRMRLNPVHLAGFHRLLHLADKVVTHQLEEAESLVADAQSQVHSVAVAK